MSAEGPSPTYMPGKANLARVRLYKYDGQFIDIQNQLLEFRIEENVGNVFMKARELRPDLDMYFDDKHPSTEASYLIALTFYKYLTGKSVMHIPTRLMTQDIHGDMLYLCFILPSDAAFLKQLVEEYDMPIANMKK